MEANLNVAQDALEGSRGRVAQPPWTLEDLEVGRRYWAEVEANPVRSARWPWRVSALEGRGLPKVGLLEAAGELPISREGSVRVQLHQIDRGARHGRGKVVFRLTPEAALLGPDVWAPPETTLKIALLLERRRNLLLVGPQGCGKSTLVRTVAERSGMRFVLFPCAAVVEPSDFSATLQIVAREGGGVETRYIPTLLLRALDEASRRPHERTLVFLDEWNRCPEEARNAMMASLDASRIFWNPLVQDYLPIPDNVQFAAAVNVGKEFTGTYGIDPAQLDRFAPLRLSWMPASEEVAHLRRRYPEALPEHLLKLVTIANTLREDTAIRGTISVRATEEAADLLQDPYFRGMSAAEAMLAILDTCFCGRLGGTPKAAGSDAAEAWARIRSLCSAASRGQRDERSQPGRGAAA